MFRLMTTYAGGSASGREDATHIHGTKGQAVVVMLQRFVVFVAPAQSLRGIEASRDSQALTKCALLYDPSYTSSPLSTQ